MTRRVRCRPGAAVTALGLTLLAGCLQGNPRLAPPSPLPGAGEPSAALQASQVADVQVAMGRALEKRGSAEQALEMYQKALKQDPSRTDVYARLAALYDRQGKF